MSNDRPCNMEGFGTVLIKMFDRIVRELKEVRYVEILSLLVPWKHWVLRYLLEMMFSR